MAEWKRCEGEMDPNAGSPVRTANFMQAIQILKP